MRYGRQQFEGAMVCVRALRCHGPARRAATGAPLLLALVLACGAVSPASAAEPFAGPVNPLELRAFVDGVMTQQRITRPFAGCIVTVVKDDRVFLNAGYGYADVGRRQVIDPDRTLFRIGSVSKVFVYLAARGEVAAGRLRLDAPIGAYLAGGEGALEPERFGPALDGPAITLRHLLTHTAGFDEQVVGLFARDRARVRPLAAVLARELPERVRPAGDASSYSNHGSALVAHLVERVSGVPYPDYLRTRLLEPLGMTRTTLEQPPPDALDAQPALPYRDVGGRLERADEEVVPLAAIGGMASTGTDMAALLRELIAPRGLALPAREVLALRETLFAADARAPGVLFGLMATRRKPPAFGHDGGTPAFHTQMRVYPEQRTGLFTSCNFDSSGPVVDDLVRAFEAHYFEVGDVSEVADVAATRDRAFVPDDITGWYAPLRVSETTIARAAKLFSASAVTLDDRGELRVDGPERTRRFLPVARDMWRSPDDGTTLLFEPAGRVLVAGSPAFTLQRVPLLDRPPIAAAWLLLAVAGCLVFVVRVPASLLLRGRRALADVGTTRATTWPAYLACLAGLFGVCALLFVAASPDAIVFAERGALRVLAGLPTTAALAWVVALAMCVRDWRAGRRPDAGLLAALVATGLLIAWFHHWNLLGFHYPAAGD